MGRRSFAVHRWLGLAIGIQLLLWSVGGLIFSTHSISWVRGNDGRKEIRAEALPLDSIAVTPGQAAKRAGLGNAETIILRSHIGDPVYEVRGEGGRALVHANSGELLSPLSKSAAEKVALRDRAGTPAVSAISLLEEDPPTEYREGELPAWRVVLRDGDNTHIYVSASTGKITARRNDAWRRFDFFWMLHTMDYGGRDDFNHPLLIIASLVAVLSVLSGWLLWGLRISRRRRRKKAT